MDYTISVTLDTSKLDSIISGLEGKKRSIGKIVGSEGEGIAKSLAPVRTGLLRSTIQQNYPGGDIIAQVLQDGNGANYGIYQEFGTYKMAAHPFMTPMAEQMIGRYSSPSLWKPLFE
jgi:HK97 gp10 family phage protein